MNINKLYTNVHFDLSEALMVGSRNAIISIIPMQLWSFCIWILKLCNILFQIFKRRIHSISKKIHTYFVNNYLLGPSIKLMRIIIFYFQVSFPCRNIDKNISSTNNNYQKMNVLLVNFISRVCNILYFTDYQW